MKKEIIEKIQARIEFLERQQKKTDISPWWLRGLRDAIEIAQDIKEEAKQ